MSDHACSAGRNPSGLHKYGQGGCLFCGAQFPEVRTYLDFGDGWEDFTGRVRITHRFPDQGEPE